MKLKAYLLQRAALCHAAAGDECFCQEMREEYHRLALKFEQQAQAVATA